MSEYADALFDLRVRDLSHQDVGHVIIAHALVDQMLGTLILAYLPKEVSEDDANTLLSYRGPFGSLRAKTTFASSLGLIGDETRRDLKGINAVRNTFAHPNGRLSFASPEVAAVFEQHGPATEDEPQALDDRQAFFNDRVDRAAKAMKATFDSLLYAQSVGDNEEA